MKRSKAVAPHRAAAASLVLVMSAAAVMSVGAGGCKKKQEGEKQMQEKPASEPFPLELRAVTLPSKSADSVDVRVLFQSGSVDDPKGKEGLTYVTAKMLAEGGTKQHAYAEVLQLLYPMAATIDVDVSRQMTVFVGRAHKDHLDSYFPLLFEVILEPRFAQEDFNRIKDETLNYIRKTLRQSDDELLSREALDVWIYEDHPYGHVVEGTVAGIESITLEDVKAHFAKVFTRDRLTVGLAGAVDDALLTMVKDRIKALPEKGADPVKIPEAKMPEGLEVKVVEKITDSTAIAMGVPVDIKRGHPDFFPLMLAFSCLGEHRQSMGRLFKTLREVRGLNYGDYAYIEHFIQEGWSTKPMVNVGRSRQEMSVWIRPVQPRHAVLAVKLALHELKKFIEKGLTQEELDRTRGFLLGYTRVLEESAGRRLGYALDDLFYKTPPHLKMAREAFQNMTLQEVNDAIKRSVSMDNLKIIVVTKDGKEFKEQLLSKDASPVAYDTPKPPEVLEEDRAVLAVDPGFSPEKITVIPVDSLFQ
jgi:zinc protease